MPRKRFTAEQIINKLREGEAELSRGLALGCAVKRRDVTEQTYCRWLDYRAMARADIVYFLLRPLMEKGPLRPSIVWLGWVEGLEPSAFGATTRHSNH